MIAKTQWSRTLVAIPALLAVLTFAGGAGAAERIQVDPPPEPSKGSRAEAV